MAVEITSTSKHTKTRKGSKSEKGTIASRGGKSLECGDIQIGATNLGHAQYTIVYGKGSKRKSETLHCSEEQIQNYKKQLEKAGY